MLEEITLQTKNAISELIELAGLKKNDLLVIGCSSSEVSGHEIGSFSSMEIAAAIFAGVKPCLKESGIFLAAQCCEHLNRAIIIERDAMEYYRLEQVNVVPQPKAGGSFATTAYQNFKCPVAVEHIKAKAGIDIGKTLIGMHLAEVAVPIRLQIKQIGSADITCARTRPRCIGGDRANYDDSLM